MFSPIQEKILHSHAFVAPETFDPKPGDRWVSVYYAMHGWKAVLYWMNGEDLDFPFPEPWETGFLQYTDRNQALSEALDWALSEDLPLVVEPQGETDKEREARINALQERYKKIDAAKAKGAS